MIKKITFIFLFIVSFAISSEWQVVSKMPHPVAGGQALVLDSLIYIFGGFSDSSGKAVSLIQIYDPQENFWRIGGNMLLPRHGFVADILNDSIIVYCGGVWENSRDMFSIEYWNRYSNAISAAEIRSHNSNFNRALFTGHIYKNQLYLFGGIAPQSVVDTVNLPYIVKYDLDNSSSNALHERLYESNFLPYHHMSVRADSLVYIFGGVHFNVSNQVMAFNLENHEIKSIGRLAGVRAGGAAVVQRGKFYIIGGYNESAKALNSTEIYRGSNDGIRIGPQLHYNRRDLMAVIYDNSIYVFGGKNQYDVTVPGVEKLDLVTSISQEELTLPEKYILYDNYPNPFNAGTVISWQLPVAGDVELTVYNMLGQKISTLLEQYQTPGRYQIRWDAGNLASGIYYYRIKAGVFQDIKRMVLIK